MTKTITAINLMAWDQVVEKNDQPSEQVISATAKNSWDLCPGKSLTLQYPGVYLEDHWSTHGFVDRNDYSVDLRDWHRLELVTELPIRETLEMRVEIGLLKNNSPMPEEIEYVSARALVITNESGNNEIVFPLNLFDDYKALAGKWKFVRSVRLTADWKDLETREPILVRKIQFVRRPSVYVNTTCYSQSVVAGETAHYSINLHNCTGEVQPVILSREKYGWETMKVRVEPEDCVLQPWDNREISVYVEVPERIAPGGYEIQKLKFVPGGHGEQAETLTLTTLRELPHPYIKHTESGWDEVRQNIREYDWVRELKDQYEDRAERWKVPQVNTGPFLFHSHHAFEAENAAIVWKLTGRADIANKAVQFLRATVDPARGYPVTYQACHQELVHEGEFFKHTAVVYDLLADSGLLTDEDHAHIKHSFRLFMDLIDWSLTIGDLSNWTVSEMIGALYCSQALQDLERMNRFLYGIGGFEDHLSKGTLDDGWWYECSVGYNMMVAGLFTEVVQSCRPWGLNLAETWLPSQYHDQIIPGSNKPDKDGLCLDIWGPRRLNYRSIRQLWDSLLPFADYRGVVFGINDSTETKLLGISVRGYMDGRYDLAYYVYRQPEYADIVLSCKLEDRDLLYAVPNIQTSQAKPYLKSAYADTSGVAVLRSQTRDREPREQIQAVVKYGIHGGAHGHYDRVSLLSIMRYGRSFYNPESIWYSYHTFMYKFYVQSSITHNMVVVDRKQQDPAEGKRLLFHSGSVFQACAVENTARWSYPPYGGWRVDDENTFGERTWSEGRYMPIPEPEPEYTKRTDYTEPILQRRLTVVTDDYIVLFDYVSGDQDHEYDCLFHCKGLMHIEGESQHLRKQTDQFDSDSRGGAQLITDCEWYDMKGPVKAHFEMGFGQGYDNRGNRTEHNVDGPLIMDHYSLWPPQPEIIVGNLPELNKVDKRLFYEIRGDGRVLTSGKFGAWILGREDLDLGIEGVTTLELRVKTEEGVGDNGLPKTSEPSIFWGDPYIETESGHKIYLSDLPLITENTNPGNGIGVDYFGGPVKIAVKQFDRAIPANPLDTEHEGIIRLDLSVIQAKRLVTSIGSDYPLGDETLRRKMLSTRSVGRNARFITLIEPYEDQPMIVLAVAHSADEAQVVLADGRTQIIRISSLDDAIAEPVVEIIETDMEGQLLRREIAINK
ncbi:COG1470 family protein [Paenibacillus xylanexedens]|uniref:COG1470 family protein n=1 Tax=Paenibacillus xylanexedens TaxID=528191 RepID=UPI0011A9701E|nr:heparinase II/III family protein [Paenibacillus xylanexedens]